MSEPVDLGHELPSFVGVYTLYRMIGSIKRINLPELLFIERRLN